MRWLAPNDRPAAGDQAPGSGEPAEGRRPTVLVADDNQEMRRYITGLLADTYDVVTAVDGVEALEAARSVRPDLILSDVMMPNLDGFGLLRALRTEPATSGTPVILLSARAGEDSAVEGLEGGADDYLIKPFSSVELLARVRSNLELERTRRAAARREHQIAVELQERLVPNRSFRSPLFEIATYYQSGVLGTQVGGDWFDVIDLGRTRTALVVGDVMGKGIPAASTMGQLRSTIRAYAGLDMAPADLLEAVDTRVRELRTEQIASCIYAVVDSRAQTLEVANAGHPPPLLVAAGTVERLSGPVGPPLGAGPAAIGPLRVGLQPGSTLVLYTDGLVETRTGDTDRRIDEAAAIVRDWDGDIDGLPEALVSRLCPAGSPDDVAILVARVLPVGQLPTAETTFDSGAEAPAAARRFSNETMAGWAPAPAPAPGDLDLVVSELVTNAIIHGRPPTCLRLTHLGDEILVEVEDGSAFAPRLQHPRPHDEHGRGLRITAALARRSGVSLSPTGKTVWCTLRVVPTRSE
jgi:serine phosphatase RsbU (regulator of sigma subunit)